MLGNINIRKIHRKEDVTHITQNDNLQRTLHLYMVMSTLHISFRKDTLKGGLNTECSRGCFATKSVGVTSVYDFLILNLTCVYFK